jgi:hypothetical protein
MRAGRIAGLSSEGGLTMTSKLLAAAVATAAISLATAAQAQEAAPAPAAETQCELHIWPAERFNAMTTGWLSGFGAIGAVADAASNADKNKDNRTQMAAALDSPGQLEALKAMNLPELLATKASRIVTHDEPLDRKVTVESSPFFGPLACETMKRYAAGETIEPWVKVEDRIFTPENAAEHIDEAY